MPAIPPGTLEAFGLYLVRTSALMIATPLYGTATGFSGYRVALIVAVSFLLYTVGGAPLSSSTAPFEYACLVLRELMIGLFLAFSLQAALVAIRVAGELVGHEMGFNMASLVDPTTGVSAPLVTQIYEVFFFLGLLAVDGHHLLLSALGDSFQSAPVGALDLSGDIAWIAQAQFTQMFAAGITFAAPVVILLFLTSLLVGVLARAVPHLQIMEVGFSARIAVGLIGLLIFAPQLVPALTGLYRGFANGLEGAVEAIAR